MQAGILRPACPHPHISLGAPRGDLAPVFLENMPTQLGARQTFCKPRKKIACLVLKCFSFLRFLTGLARSVILSLRLEPGPVEGMHGSPGI